MDVRRPESQLKGPRRGEVSRGDPEFASEFEADDLGAPMGVVFLHGAGLSHDLVVYRATTTVLIARLEAVTPALLEASPDLPDRVIRQGEIAGDMAKILAVKPTADDFLTDQHR
jgi:hypothetical protein